MSRLFEHLRDKLVAGAFAAVPVVIVVYAAIWIEANTKHIAAALGLKAPGLGVLIVIAGVYLLGILVTSVLGRMFFHLANAFFRRIPGLKFLYQTWKDLLVVAPDQPGMFNQAVLVSVGEGRTQVGFTSGRSLPGDPRSICVFLPNIPNPISGRLVIVPREACVPLKLSIEEALKFQISSGNYLPQALTGAPGNAASPN